MVTLSLIIFLIVFVIFTITFINNTQRGYDWPWISCFSFIMMIIFGFTAFCFIIWEFYLINEVGTGHVYQEKIAMYEEQNVSIEESINLAVSSYMDFETETYSNLKNESLISLISLYPELKSDELVQRQIDVYLSNNRNIIQLKESNINLSKQKWLLYFGK